MKTQEKTTLTTLISDGNIQQAIDELLSVKRNESLDKEALAIASRYNRLKREERSGTLSFEEIKRTENQITEHLIALINHPETEAYPAEKSIYTSDATTSLPWKYIITTTIVAVVLISLAEAFNITDIIPSNDPKYLVVYVQDMEGNPALELKGKINIPLGNRSLGELIDEDGRAEFFDIIPTHENDTIRIGLDAEGWEIISENTFVFTGDPVTITVKRDNSLGIIKGTVRSRDGQEFIEGAMIVVSGIEDMVTYTDALGFFQMTVPEESRIKDENRQYRLIISKEGYKTTDYDYGPLSTGADIRMNKAENK